MLVTASLRASDGEHVELRVEQAVAARGYRGAAGRARCVSSSTSPATATRSTLDRVHDALLRHEGKLGVRVRLRGGEWTADVLPNRVVGVDPNALLPALNAILGPGHVEFVYNGNGG